MPIKVVLDTDIGSDIDDAVCLAYLLAQPECDLLGITLRKCYRTSAQALPVLYPFLPSICEKAFATRKQNVWLVTHADRFGRCRKGNFEAYSEIAFHILKSNGKIRPFTFFHITYS